jgi:multisubunit Na+/H+ antiporter MnhE subunit
VANRRVGRYVVHWILWWVVLMALWLLLTGAFDPQETGVGVGAAALAATAALVVEVNGVVHLRLRATIRWLPKAAWLPARVVTDNWTVLSALVLRIAGRRDIRGAFRALPFDPGTDDADSATRRALLTWAICLAPNTYVVGIDRDAGLILCHQLLLSDPQTARADILGDL